MAGQITEQIITNNFKDEVQPTIDQFTAHQKVLMNLYEIYPKNIPDNEDWKLYFGQAGKFLLGELQKHPLFTKNDVVVTSYEISDEETEKLKQEIPF